MNTTPQGRLGRFMSSVTKQKMQTHHNAHELTSTISSQIMMSLSPNSRKADFNEELCFVNEDNITDLEFRQDMNLFLRPKNYTDDVQNKLRENLICKVKKVCDEFKLSDDTFYRTVFMYDYQERKIVADITPRYLTMKS
jgi:hypothetical protein